MNDLLQEYNNGLASFRERYIAFLSKLEARAKELEEETLVAGQEILDNDEFRFIHFKAGIKGQFDALTKKAKDVYKEQIKEYKIRSFHIGENGISEDEADTYSKKIQSTYQLLDDFIEKIDTIFNAIFDQVKVISPEKKLKQLLEEYEITKEQFSCTQCGSQLKLDKFYFVSAYVTCEYCQTQNTFVPSMKMALLPDLVREIADNRTGNFDLNSEDTLLEKFKYWEDHSRKQLFIKSSLIPELQTSYKDIYLREMNDFKSNYIDDYTISSNDLDQLINHLETQYSVNINEVTTSLESKSEAKKMKVIDDLLFKNQLNQKLLEMEMFNQSTNKQTAIENFQQENQKLQHLKSNINL